jgi:hypothetical protein
VLVTLHYKVRGIALENMTIRLFIPDIVVFVMVHSEDPLLAGHVAFEI